MFFLLNLVYLDVSPKNRGYPQNGLLIMENLIKMDDLGGNPPIFWKHPNLLFREVYGCTGFSFYDSFPGGVVSKGSNMTPFGKSVSAIHRFHRGG